MEQVNEIHSKSRGDESKLLTQYPDLKNNIQIFKQVLLPLELSLLKQMLSCQRPMTTSEIYFGHIKNYFKKQADDHDLVSSQSFVITSLLLGSIKNKLPTNLFKRFNLTNDQVINGLSVELTEFPPVTKQIKKNLNIPPSIHAIFEPRDPYNKKSETDKVRIKEVILRALNISFPSYPKIQQTLETLKEYGLIAIRTDNTDKKASYYWIIKPSFSLLYQNKFKDILSL